MATTEISAHTAWVVFVYVLVAHMIKSDQWEKFGVRDAYVFYRVIRKKEKKSDQWEKFHIRGSSDGASTTVLAQVTWANSVGPTAAVF